MNKIRTYVDNVFAAIPASAEADEMKRNIMESMEDGYQAMLEEGKSEDEAFGAVIGQFGTVEEIKEALGAQGAPEEFFADAGTPVPPEMLEEYLVFRRKFALAIAGGVAFIILGVLSAIVLERFGDVFMGIGLFGCVAVGVGIIIYFGIQEDNWNKIEKSWKRSCEAARMSWADPGATSEARRKTRKKQKEALSSIIMLGATLYFFISGFVFGNWGTSWIAFVVGGIICGLLDEILKLKEK